jgi:hypothetical protein
MDASCATSPTIPVMPFVESIRSDELPKLALVLRQIRSIPDLGELFQVNVILDANVVIRELIWLSKKRTNPKARPEVLELIECETVRAHAPTFLNQEIEAKIPVVAKQRKVPEETLRGHWAKYRERIKFTDVGGPTGIHDRPRSKGYAVYSAASEDRSADSVP